jgi:hypothetical protein
MAKRYSILTVLILVLPLFLFSGCGPSPEMLGVEQTRKEVKAADVKTAALPLFSYPVGEDISVTNLPTEITSLPLFENAGAPPHIDCRRVGTNTLFFATGSGFGHWGLIIHHPEVDPEATKSLHATIIPWEDGLFFWIEK